MRPTVEPLLHWTPRIIGLLLAGFLSALALNVFEKDYAFRQTNMASAMDLIPTAVVLCAVAISWRWAWAGGLMFVVLGLWYLEQMWARFHWPGYFVIAGPVILLGLLFEIDWFYVRLGTR